jgi:protein TonB
MLQTSLVTVCLLATALVPAEAQLAAHAAPTISAASPGPSPTAPTVYFAADEMPSFPGGSAEMLRFLGSRLNYPPAALDRSVSGKVHVRFTVDPEGHLHDPQVVRGLGSGLDEEALRLVRLMPWWNPGKIQGRPVWVSLTLPITFRAL